MERSELIAEAMKAVGNGEPLAALEVVYRAYEEGVAKHREVREAQQNTVGFKAAAEKVTEEISPETVELAYNTMQQVRELVYGAIRTDNQAAVLLYETLNDYAKDDVKVYRDFIVNQRKRTLEPAAPEDGEDADVPTLDFSVEDLAALKKNAEAFWTIAGSPALKRRKEDDEFTPATKTLKSGADVLSFSKLPRSEEAGESGKSESDSSVTVSRLRYSVDGTELPIGTSLSAVGMWYLSSADWTVSVADIKAAVQRKTGVEYGDLDGFADIEVNGHTISRWREKA